MKVSTISLLLIMSFTSLSSFAETVYVRKSVTVNASEQQGAEVREALKKSLATDNKIALTPGQAHVALRAIVNKSADSQYLVRIERFNGGKLDGVVGESSDADYTKAYQAAVLAATQRFSSSGNHLSEQLEQPHEVDSRNPSAQASGPLDSSGEVVHSEKAHYVKNWYGSIGPVVSNNLVGNNGTKLAIDLGYNQGLSEHFNLLYFYDLNFNTASFGSTAVSELGAALSYYTLDRGADFSPFFRVDFGYGGGNKNNDAGAIAGVGIGAEMYRTQSASFQILVRDFVLLTNASTNANGVTSTTFPTVFQVLLGIFF